MTDRETQRTRFVAEAGWGEATLSNLAGDASNRRYFRLRQRGTSAGAVLMDAPPEKGEDVRPFVTIATHLRAAGLSAPEIYAEDPGQGFLLLEDLGDDLFARVVLDQPLLEMPLYESATDTLVALHERVLPAGIDTYTSQIMADLAALAFDWYRLGLAGDGDAGNRARFVDWFQPMLEEKVCGEDPILIQRDYHAENLLWLPERDGVARVGLLDFQDAMAGHRAYDLVSLLQDARRDVLPSIEKAMVARYVDQAGVGYDSFRKAYLLLGVQRNLRILGVFARLCLRDGKPHYVDLIPRVWAHLIADLKAADLAELETFLLQSLPEPTPENLELLKSKCATRPTP